MTGIELLQTYPNAAKVVKEWFMEQMIASMASDNITPDEFKQAMIDEGISDERLGIMIDLSPRMLFDVLDEHGFYILTSTMHEINSKPEFYFHVYGELDDSSTYKIRKEGEANAIFRAFALLEEKLTGNLNFEQLNKEEYEETK